MKQTRTKSPQRILVERLQLGKCKPRAWAVALALEAYARLERHTGKRISSLYHEMIAEITGMSVGNVRRALVELTTGDRPLYRKRNATGRQHTILGTNDWELTTTGVIYEWIEDGPRAAMPSPPQGRTARRGLLGRHGRKPTPRCLTRPQVVQFATDVADDLSYAEMQIDGQERVAEYHALRRHVEDAGCADCQVAVAQEMAAQFPERFEAMRPDERCQCGARVVRKNGEVFDLWRFATGETEAPHRCDTPSREMEPMAGDQGRGPS